METETTVGWPVGVGVEGCSRSNTQPMPDRSVRFKRTIERQTIRVLTVFTFIIIIIIIIMLYV